MSSVYTDEIWPSVSTDEITDGVNAVGNGDLKLSTELSEFLVVRIVIT
jgi:hypothetical protein